MSEAEKNAPKQAMGTVASVDGDTIVVDQLMQVAGKSLAFRIKFFV